MKAMSARDMQKIVWVQCVNCRSLADGMDQKCLALTHATKKTSLQFVVSLNGSATINVLICLVEFSILNTYN